MLESALGDPKPRRIRVKSTRARVELRGAVMAQFGRSCACGCGRPGDTIHHLLGGSYREDVVENLVAIAGTGTTLCHGAITSRNRTDDCDPVQVARGIRRTLERRFPEKIAYMLSVAGCDVVDRLYPPETLGSGQPEKGAPQ